LQEILIKIKEEDMNTSLISLNVEGIQEAVRQAIREEIGKQVKNVVIQAEPLQPEYYDRKQLCELAHISPSTLWRMEEDGIIQKLKFGRRNLYSKAEVDNLIISGKLAKYSRRK
jgi:hypothetical protein